MPLPILPLLSAGSIALSGGGTGYISVPHADTLTADSFIYQHDTGVIAINDPRARALKRSATDHVQFSLSSRFEFGARLTTWYAESTGERSYNDLSGHFKLQLLETDRFRMAVGARDFAGESTSLDPAYFVVGDWYNDYLSVSAGFGVSDAKESALAGAFGGIRLQPWPWLAVMADHDGRESQAGVQLQHSMGKAAVFLKGYYSTNEVESVAYAAGIQVQLGQSPEGRLRREEYPQKAIDSTNSAVWMDATLLPWGADVYREMLQDEARLSQEAGQCGPDVAYLAQQVPLLSAQCQDYNYTVGWSSQFNGVPKPQWSPAHLQIRLEPSTRYSVGTEFGRFDYSLALRSSAQLLLPFGLSAYAAWDVPVDDSEGYDERSGAFRQSRFESGLYEQAVQLTAHPLPGFFAQAQLGRTRIGDELYDFSRLEMALHLFAGRVAVAASSTGFDVPYTLGVAERQTLGRAFVWITPGVFAGQLTSGDFQYQDKGTRLDLYRYIGRIRLGVYGKFGDDFKAVGFAVSMPLTGRGAWRSKYVSLAGAPHFQPTLETQVDSDDGVNLLRPNFMKEFVPQRDLVDDVLDQWRASPAYFKQ